MNGTACASIEQQTQTSLICVAVVFSRNSFEYLREYILYAIAFDRNNFYFYVIYMYRRYHLSLSTVVTR